MNENSILNSSIEDVISKTSPAPKLVFKLNKTARYIFLKYDDVPPGWYYSEIMAIESSVTTTGKPAFDVCYKIVDWYHLIRTLNGTLPEDHQLTYYYVRERCVYGAVSERAFTKSMVEGCGFDEDYEFEVDEVIGVCERYKISYKTEDSLGSIDKRMVVTDEYIEDYIDYYS